MIELKNSNFQKIKLSFRYKMSIELNKIKRNKIAIVIIATTVAAAFIHIIHNTNPIKNESLLRFPLSFGLWSGKNIPMEKWVYDSLETPYAILRDYTFSDSATVNLAVVWYDDREIAFHAPEACLGGYGNKVKEKNNYILKISSGEKFPLGKMIVERGDQKFIVLYYFINDGFVTHNQILLRTKIMNKRLKLKRTSAAFIRLMISIPDDKEKSRRILEKFFEESIEIIINYTNTPRSA
jgi:EpsI family protein